MPVDKQNATEWFKKAAAQGFTKAQTALALRYQRGDGVEADDQNAARLFEEAAKNGDSAAQVRLGQAYMSGTGVPKDPSKAEYWLRLAADNGRRDANNPLSKLEQSADAQNVPSSDREKRQEPPDSPDSEDRQRIGDTPGFRSDILCGIISIRLGLLASFITSRHISIRPFVTTYLWTAMPWGFRALDIRLPLRWEWHNDGAKGSARPLGIGVLRAVLGCFVGAVVLPMCVYSYFMRARNAHAIPRFRVDRINPLYARATCHRAFLLLAIILNRRK